MTVQWVKFIKAFDQPEDKEKKIEAKKFLLDDMIGIDEVVAKSLKEFGFVEFIDEPEDKDDLDSEMKKAFDGIRVGLEKTVSDILTKSLASLGAVIEAKLPDLTKDQKERDEKNRGFHDEAHFMQSVLKAANPAKFAYNVGGEDGNAGVELLNKAPTGQSVSNDPEGGFAVPDVMANTIWDNMGKDDASILPRTDRWETPGNSLTIPRLFEGSRKSGAGNRYGGIVTTWLDEAEEIQAAKATMGRMNMQVRKLGAVVYFTSEALSDAPASFSKRIKDLVPKAINFAVEEAFFHGTGVGKPKGVLQGDSVIVIAPGARDGAAQDNHTILHWNLNQMYWRHWNRNNAVWFMHSDVAQQLEYTYFADDTTNKRPFFTPPGGLADTPLGRLYGRPAVVTEHMMDFGSRGDIGFFDWSQYATLTKTGGGISTASSIHVRFLFEEEAFRFTFRIDGREHWTSVKEDLNGDTTRSPFLIMGARTGGGTSSGL